jgi:hypothetical protein
MMMIMMIENKTVGIDFTKSYRLTVSRKVLNEAHEFDYIYENREKE